MKKNKLFGLFVALFFITIISFVISQETNSLNVYNNITNSQIITNLPYQKIVYIGLMVVMNVEFMKKIKYNVLQLFVNFMKNQNVYNMKMKFL